MYFQKRETLIYKQAKHKRNKGAPAAQKQRLRIFPFGAIIE